MTRNYWKETASASNMYVFAVSVHLHPVGVAKPSLTLHEPRHVSLTRHNLWKLLQRSVASHTRLETRPLTVLLPCEAYYRL